MAVSFCLSSHPQILYQIDRRSQLLRPRHKLSLEQTRVVSLHSSSQLFGQPIPRAAASLNPGRRFYQQKKWSGIRSCWLPGSQVANCAFTLGTVAVLPFYSLMVFAPKSEITKKTMRSCIPYVVLGIVYAYLLFRSWTPDTIHLMFASKYWLPELSGIAKMFSNEMTLASAWIHLLAVDLFAARQVYHDGLKNDVETRHSVSFCLLTCPVGILLHTLTKVLTEHNRSRKQQP